MSGYQYRVIISGGCGTPVTSNPASLTVNKKEISGNFTADDKVYDGNTSATVLTRTLNGVISPDAVTLIGGTATFNDANAGIGKTVTLTGASLSGADVGNYTLTAVNNTTANIDKAPTVTTVTINGGPFTYTGSEIEPATVTVTGAGGLNLTPAASYANNINAGTATASYSYEESANHLASSDSKNFTIGKADATIVVTGKTVTYDGTAHGATGTAKGVMGEDLAGLDLGATFTNVPGGTANWTFTDVTGNYNNASGSVDIVINKAPTVTTVTINGGPFTYTGSEITPATVTVTGAGGLNLTPAASYANNINAGTATASYSYEESANHLASSD
ncbi:MAG: hypothetical protein KGZ90_15560, partial [Algoriphagus sp.]|nr:hypothetical protein [Algoriphagus sp.]